MRSLKPSEHQIQAAFVQWIRQAYPHVIAYSVPNGAHLAGTPGQRAAKMAKLKAEGLMPGAPDFNIDYANFNWYGMRIEFKAPGRKPDEHQLERINAFRKQGYYAVWTNSIDSIILSVTSYMKNEV